jgi:hypothetical protein
VTIYFSSAPARHNTLVHPYFLVLLRSNESSFLYPDVLIMVTFHCAESARRVDKETMLRMEAEAERLRAEGGAEVRAKLKRAEDEVEGLKEQVCHDCRAFSRFFL